MAEQLLGRLFTLARRSVGDLAHRDHRGGPGLLLQQLDLATAWRALSPASTLSGNKVVLDDINVNFRQGQPQARSPGAGG